MIAKLNEAWQQRLKFRAEGDRLCREWNPFWEEGHKLCTEADKLWEEGEKLWAAAVGNIPMKWLWRYEKQAYACKLQTGEVFEP